MKPMRLDRVFAAISVILLTGCAVTPTTDIQSMDGRIADQTQREKVGIAKFDIFATTSSDNTAAFAAGFAGGLVGGLVYLAVQDAINNVDYSIDAEAVRLHESAFNLLVTRLEDSGLVEPVSTANAEKVNPVEISRKMRDLKMYGSSPPKIDEVRTFVSAHALDYAIYSGSFIGDNPSGQGVFMATKWVLYNSKGEEATSVFTRSLTKNSLKKLTPAQVTDQFIALFGQNIDKLFAAIAAGESTG